jgi:hypothetical protein
MNITNVNIPFLLLLLVFLIYKVGISANSLIILFLCFPVFFIFYTMNIPTSSANFIPQKTGITIDCNVLDPKIIKKCDPKSSICESCQCSSDPNALLGCMECTEVTDTNPYIVDMEDSKCTDPYHLIGGKCQLQNGHYCLPHKIEDIKCNKFTGDKLLSKKGRVYNWNCVCKNPYEFTGGDCSSIKMCGIEGDTQKKGQVNNSGRYLVNKSDPTDLWTEDSTWNPITDGICKCRNNEFYSDVNKACLPNNCGEGGTLDTSNKLSCICPATYIDCQSINIAPDAPDGKGLCAMPSCVPDPCYTLGGNNKIGTNGKCSCDNANGFYNVPDVNSVIGYSCQKLCNPGPCGDRGKCFVWKGNNVSKWKISCLNTDDSGMNCKDWQRIIKIDQTSNYMTNTTSFVSVAEGGGDVFMFEPVTPTNVFNLKDGEKYYLKDANGQYIDFKNNLKSDTKNADMIIQLKDDLQSTGNVYTIYLISQNMYVSMSDMKITLSQNWKDTERCGSEDSDDCNDGYNQDKNHYCNETDVGTCIGSGFLCYGATTDNCKPGFRPTVSISGTSCACICE